jgi:transcription initiation factor TFIID TATA-box-binding protein
VITNVIKTLRKIGVKITEKPKINVQNIVASGTVNLTLNLNALALELENTEYEPEQFPGLVYKLNEPNATFLLFSNGKLVCTGTKNRQELDFAKKQLLKNLKSAISHMKGKK